MEFRFAGRFTCTEAKITFGDGDRVAVVSLARYLNARTATELFGPGFAGRLFGGSFEREAERFEHDWKGSIKPTAELERHLVTISRTLAADVQVSSIPVVSKLTPRKASADILMVVELPVTLNRPRLASELAAFVGEQVRVVFEPAQLSLLAGSEAS